LKYFLSNPSQILNFRNGGLAIYGGLIVGILTAIIICRKKKIDVLNFLDYVIPFVALAQAIGRWGNFFNIEAYGSQTVSIFRMGIETANGYLEVHPVFLYESISNFLIFIFLRILQKNRKFNGEILLVYCMLYSFVRSFLEGLRIDSLMFFSFRISQILSIFIFIISLIIFYKKIKDTKKILKKNVE
jgi:prolipoprotein diacylglyceryl transferase